MSVVIITGSSVFVGSEAVSFFIKKDFILWELTTT